MKEAHDEMVELSAALRRRLERERRRGRKTFVLGGILPDAEPAAMGPARVPAPVTQRGKASPRSAPAASSAPRTSPSPAPKTASKTAASPAADDSRGKKLPRIEIEPEAADYAGRMQELAALGEEASGCEKCGLCETRTQVVFARGNARNRVMFIGEAPGADEDRLGSPFVGRAGKLLDQIIDAIGFQRDEIYVANILKCRPPQNRDPKPEEIEACTPYLRRQIELVNPKIICALGRFAAQFLTGKPKAPMGALRGKIHYYENRIMVLPTYHPAALLRNPNWKRVVWEDVQVLRKEYLR